MKACESAKSNGGVPNWDWVERAVAASEPPNIANIKDHISFIRKWGGGNDQRFIVDMMDFIEEKMPNGRVVSGFFSTS